MASFEGADQAQQKEIWTCDQVLPVGFYNII